MKLKRYMTALAIFSPLVLDEIVFTTWGGTGGEVRYNWRDVEGVEWGERSTSGHS